ncbi:bikaverin cluster-monooxygenase [Fusarium heterosporum]|uniref:Bikaverin cluster-monooxygenase n=1 Tax=Fusarium heterosporum TaxID=42747 RepID=A0A8H5TVC3_FUSHE|nr:bikaverin cluster-monooxygenase [Fusarium heterosporum]
MAISKQHPQVIIAGARDSLKSDRGAGIGLQPNGLRILDQLGLVDEIEEATTPITKCFSYDEDSNLMSVSIAMGKFRERTGYPFAFIERQKLLSIMTGRLQRIDCIRTSARVALIEEAEKHVVVTTTTGEVYTGDVLIGADGVRSVVRTYIDASVSDRIADEYIKVGFSTVYGMSSPTKGISAGERFVVYRKGETVLGFTGKGGVIFWFVFENLNHYVPLSQAKRYAEADVEELCKAVFTVQCTPSLKFEAIYNNRIAAMRTPVEEGIAKTWHTDRTVVVGDAACKTTPAGGQGANQAIESCAVLINKLMEAYQSTYRPIRDPIKLALSTYAKDREQSAIMTMERSQMICNSLFCLQDPTVLKDIINIGEEEFLLRALMGFSTAPVLNNVEVTTRGHFYSMAVDAVKQEIKRRHSEKP